jgi:hypothetical protein
MQLLSKLESPVTHTNIRSGNQMGNASSVLVLIIFVGGGTNWGSFETQTFIPIGFVCGRNLLLFHGRTTKKFEECRLLGYKNTVRTSQETHYVSITESSRLMLCKI